MSAEFDLIKTVGQVAGIGGIALGVFLLLFKEIIRKNIFPMLTKEQAYRLLSRISVFVFIIALVGIGAWVYTSTSSSSSGDTNTATASGSGAAVINTGKGNVNVNQ